MTEGSHTYRVTNNWYEHHCAPGDVRSRDRLDVAGQRITAQWIVWNGVAEEWAIEDHYGAFLRGITFCPFCGTELPSPPQLKPARAEEGA